MITLRTISESRRRFLFGGLALLDVASRIVSAGVQVDSLLFGSTSQITNVVSMSSASGMTVPLVVAPLVLSPIAYILGHVFVRTDAQYVRFVSLALFVGSFLLFATAPGLSVFLAALAYLVLGSGMLR